MRLGELVKMSAAIAALYNVKLPVNISYRLGKAIKKSDAEIIEYNKLKLALCQQYGKMSDDGLNWNFEGENAVSFQTEFTALENEEVDIGLPKFLISDLPANISIEASVLATLDGVVLFESLDDIPSPTALPTPVH